MSAMRQIFWRRKTKLFCRIDCVVVAESATTKREGRGTTYALGYCGQDRIELGDVAGVAREEHVLDPLVLGPDQRVQNRVHQLRPLISFKPPSSNQGEKRTSSPKL